MVVNTSGSSQTTPPPTSAPVQVGQATNTPTQGNQPTSVPGQSSPSAGTHKVGDVVSVDGWSMIVNRVKTSQGGQFDTPEHPGDTFLEIDVSVTNRTGQSQDFSSGLDFTLKDSSGQTYNQTFVSGAPAPPDGRVTDGSKLRGTVVYEVPGSMHTFEFDATPNPFARNPNIAVWNLSI